MPSEARPRSMFAVAPHRAFIGLHKCSERARIRRAFREAAACAVFRQTRLGGVDRVLSVVGGGDVGGASWLNGGERWVGGRGGRGRGVLVGEYANEPAKRRPFGRISTDTRLVGSTDGAT